MSMVPSARPARTASHVLGAAQWRVDLVDRVVGRGEVLGEQQVVRGDLGGDVDPAGLRPADDLHGPCGRDVADVQARSDMLGEQDVAGDDRLLGDRGPATQAEAAGQLALVHLGVLGQPGLLGVLGDDAIEGLDVLQRTAHEDRVGDAPAVVGEHPHAGVGVGHGPELGQPLAAEADGDRTHGEHVDQARTLAQVPHLLDDAGRVGHGIGVGHGMDGGEAAQGRGARPGQDRLGVLPSRLAQVGVQVHEARQRDQPVGVDDASRRPLTASRRRRSR